MSSSTQHPRWRVSGASARGASHQRNELPNQDAIAFWRAEGRGGEAVLAVSDGHGAARHFRSHEGARLAVQAAISLIPPLLANERGFADSSESRADSRDDLPRRLVEEWARSVERHLAEYPLTPDERARLIGESPEREGSGDPLVAYGATLLVVIATERDIEFLQLGDGDILTVDQAGRTTRPLPPDDRLVGNQTTSLCLREAWKEFRRCRQSGRGSPLPVLTLVSTDGYANSFRTDEDFLQTGLDYRDLLLRDGLDATARELPGILREATERGSGDDITLGMLVRREGLTSSASGAADGWDSEGGIDQPSRTQQEAAPLGRPADVRRRRSPATLVLSGLAIVLSLGAVHYYWPQPSPNPPVLATDGRPEALLAAAETPRTSSWVLTLEDDVQVLLEAGSVLQVEDLKTSSKGGGDFAEVLEAGVSLRLKNLSDEDWRWVVEGNGERRVPPGETLELEEDAEVDFGWMRARLRPLPPDSEGGR